MYCRILLLSLWWACFHICNAASAMEPPAATFANKTMLFVSGWPQSGTSLVQQILTVTPGMSTMVAKCRKIHGAKCENWNNEGQWLAERSNEVSPYLQPGKMCPSVGDKIDPPLESKKSLRNQWMNFWDMAQPILVEKSPQSMLKMPMLANVFRGTSAKKLKFLVVVKHPVTLNVATPTDMGWVTNTRKHSAADMQSKQVTRVSAAHSSSASGAVEATFNTDEEIADSVHFFLHFMGHRELQESKYANGQSHLACGSLGWIPAMEQLVQQLRDMKVSHPHVDVRVIRFEHFQKPYFLCKAMNAFAFDLTYSQVVLWEHLSTLEQEKSKQENVENYKSYSLAVSNICDVHFKRAVAGKGGKVSTLDDQGRGTKTFRPRKVPAPGQSHSRQRRGLQPGVDDDKVGSTSSAGAGDESVDVKVDDDFGEEEARTQAQEEGTLDVHGSAEAPLLPMRDGIGRSRTGRHKTYLGLLNQAHASRHAMRVERAKLQGSQLDKARSAANKVRPWKRKGGGGKNKKRSGKSKPRPGLRGAGKGNRRRLRLKEQEQAGQGLDFRPEIVSKTLRLRLAEFRDMFVRKAELLNKRTYKPHANQENMKSNISRSSFLFGDPSHPKPLMHKLHALDQEMRRFGYGLTHDYMPFFKEATELDEWDIMKQWRHKQSL